MKKALPFLLIFALLCPVLSGCQDAASSETPAEPSSLHGVIIDTAALGTSVKPQVEYTSTDPDMSVLLDVLLPGYHSYEIYTITATENGHAIQPAAPVDICFPLPIRFQPARHDIHICQIDSSGDVSDVPFALENGAVTISAADLGRFVLILRPKSGDLTNELNVSQDVEQFLPALNKMLTNGLPSLDMTKLTAQSALTFLYYAERDAWGFDASIGSISISLENLQRYAVKWFGIAYDFQFPTSFSGAEVTLSGNMVTFQSMGEASGAPLVKYGGHQAIDAQTYKILLFEPEIVTKQPEGIPGLDFWEGDQPGTFIVKGAAHALNIKNMDGCWQLISFA